MFIGSRGQARVNLRDQRGIPASPAPRILFPGPPPRPVLNSKCPLHFPLHIIDLVALVDGGIPG